jgi:hypothetical protein
MEPVGTILAVQACVFDLVVSKPLRIGVLASVSTGGYSNPQLQPRVYITPPANGVWEFDFLAEPPSGQAAQVRLPLGAIFDGEAPDWLKGVRVFGATNEKDGALISTLSGVF